MARPNSGFPEEVSERRKILHAGRAVIICVGGPRVHFIVCLGCYATGPIVERAEIMFALCGEAVAVRVVVR